MSGVGQEIRTPLDREVAEAVYSEAVYSRVGARVREFSVSVVKVCSARGSINVNHNHKRNATL